MFHGRYLDLLWFLPSVFYNFHHTDPIHVYIYYLIFFRANKGIALKISASIEMQMISACWLNYFKILTQSTQLYPNNLGHWSLHEWRSKENALELSRACSLFLSSTACVNVQNPPSSWDVLRIHAFKTLLCCEKLKQNSFLDSGRHHGKACEAQRNPSKKTKKLPTWTEISSAHTGIHRPLFPFMKRGKMPSTLKINYLSKWPKCHD